MCNSANPSRADALTMAADAPQDTLVDTAKVQRALNALAAAGYSRVRVMEKLVPVEHWVMYVALHTFGCLGQWPDVAPLTRLVRGWAMHFGVTERAASSRFDAMLDWVLAHADDPATRQRGWA